MRIAYITETYPPEINGVSLTAERALAHLRRAGHEVQLVRPRQAGEVLLDSAAEWRTAGGPIPMYPELRYGWASKAALRRRWARTLPDLVHVTTPGPLAWAALRTAREAGIATSADFRTNFHAYSRHYGLGWLEPVVLGYLRALHSMADCNFVPTPALAAQLAAQGFKGLQIVGRGVDSQRFSPARRDPALRQAWGVVDDEPVLLHVGRLAAEKNVGLALQAYAAVRRRRPAVRMVLVGDGPLRKRLQAAHPDVVFAGVQRGDDLARHYASADVFLFPSLTDTFGNVTLEALASGLALAAFDTAAASLHAVDGVSGCLARGSDPSAFIAAAQRAFDAAAEGGPLRRGAREAALCADWEQPLRSFEQALRAVVAARRGQTARDAALA